MIRFNEPYQSENFAKILQEVSFNKKFCGDGALTKKVHEWFDSSLRPSKTLLTTSCTHALEMMSLLIDIQPGDEVILPSYTFVSSASAFVMRGARLVFVDIRPDTMNIDEALIEQAISPRTKAIVVVHYAGVSCNMDSVGEIAKKYKIIVLEDAAQGVLSTYKGKALGAIGTLGAFSFHETKNFHCGEGGLLIINDEEYFNAAEMIREKGTNRTSFLRGEVDKYTWQCLGSSYLPSELNASILLDQLDNINSIHHKRLELWEQYKNLLNNLNESEKIELATIPAECEHNAHMFYIKVKDLEQRTKLIQHLLQSKVQAVSHYVPLHSSPAGLRYGSFSGDDKYTTKESERLLRLPMHFSLQSKDIEFVAEAVNNFFKL